VANGIGWRPCDSGLLFAQLPALPYAISAVLLAFATLSVFRIRPLPPPEENKRAHPLSRVLGGLTFVWHDRFLFGCVTLDLFAVLLGGATALLPVYARDILMIGGHHVGANGLGIMRAAPGAGAVIVALLLARRPIESGVGAKMLIAVAVYGAATIGFGLSRDYFFSLLMLASLGAADMVSVFIRNTLVQLHTPDAVRRAGFGHFGPGDLGLQ
jgi:hypothetical protein